MKVARTTAADRRLLPEGRLTGPMPWVLAIMMFLTVLAAAAGLALASAASTFRSSLGERVSIQIVDASPDVRQWQAKAALAVLDRSPLVRASRRLSAGEIGALLEPWLGSGGLEADLPVPVLIDVDLAAGGHDRLAELESAVRAAAPAARLDDNGQWLAPLGGLIATLRWLALALVVLMAAATAAAVVLASRGSLNTHRSTIEVMHLMGATDGQITRLFQRRIALDALLGGTVGFIAAALVVVLIGRQLGRVGSDLVGSVGLNPSSWLVLALLPLAGAALATLTARITVLRALRTML